MAWKETFLEASETLAAVGALNWGLVEFFDFNLVTSITSNETLLAVIFFLVAFGGAYTLWGKLQKYM